MSQKSNTPDVREHEYEVIGSSDKTIAKVWWDGKKITSDNSSYLASLDNRPIGTYTVKSGVDYLQRLPRLYRSGYIRVKKVK